MDVTLALQRAVRGFAHGTAALAARMRISETSLSHKVSPTYPGAHCSPEEALEIMEATGDHSALHVQAKRLQYVLLPAPAAEASRRGTVALVQAVKEFGELAASAAESLDDGCITANELARLQREAAEAQAAIQELMRVAQAMHRAGVPEAQ